MFYELLQNDDGTALATITAPDFLALRCFIAGKAIGRALFVQLYSNPIITADPAKQLAIRSAALSEAVENQEEGTFVAEITNVTDPWTLRNGISTDDYEGPGGYKGTLLYVLTMVALDRFAISGVKLTAKKLAEDLQSIYDLRNIAVAIRSVVETAPGLYVTYAQKAGSDSMGALDPTLTASGLAGYAYYVLDFDTTDPNFNTNLVFRAAENALLPRIFENAQLAWLYNKVVLLPADAAALTLLTTTSGDKFIHLLVNREASEASINILTDYLTKLNKNLAGAAEAAVAELNAAGKNALQIAAEQKKSNRELQRIIALLVRNANNTAIAKIGLNAPLRKVLEAVRTQDIANLPSLFSMLNNAQLTFAASWSATQTSLDKDNLQSKEVKTAFSTEYTLPSRAAAQPDMRNAIVKNAYVVGSATSLQDAFDRVSLIVEKDFFDVATITGFDFDPFGNGNSSILFAVIHEKPPVDPKQLKLLVDELKKKFSTPAAWQAYLNSAANPGGRSTLQLLIDQQTAKGTPAAAAKAIAETWLEYY